MPLSTVVPQDIPNTQNPTEWVANGEALLWPPTRLTAAPRKCAGQTKSND